MDQRMKKYLIDTNILIYYFADAIPQKEVTTVEEILRILKILKIWNYIALFNRIRNPKFSFLIARIISMGLFIRKKAAQVSV